MSFSLFLFMQILNLPKFEFNIRTAAQKTEIFDSIRKKYVILNPEEWVRQNFVEYLVQHKNFPKGRIGIEKKLLFNGMTKRTDIVVFDKSAVPQLIVECKAPEIKISQKTFDQIARYNLSLNVEYLIVSNGLNHYCCKFNQHENSYQFIPEIPAYIDL